MAKTKSDFDMVKIGQTVEEVMEFDEDGDYGFLYVGDTSDIPYESEHYTMDGHLITISYKVHENSYIVIDVHSELI